MAVMKAKKKHGAAKKAAKRKGKKQARLTVVKYGGVSKAAQEIKGGFMSFLVFGDSVAGKVQAIEEGEGTYGPETKVTVQCDDGAVVTFRAPTILRNALEQNGVVVGDTIAIEYTRDVPSPKGNPAKQFLFEHKPAKRKGRK